MQSFYPLCHDYTNLIIPVTLLYMKHYLQSLNSSRLYNICNKWWNYWFTWDCNGNLWWGFNRVILRNKKNWCILGQLRTCQYGRPSSMPLPTSNGLSKEVRIIVESAKNGRKNRPSSYSTFETRYYYMYINTIST